ncbi:M67 family metallopeptidase [Microscilla marina]|uniref:Mov34/MPN/PAD-1 family n=1 Tax=Microscilla marina ATCC 23134 TaxID=313606 RepID=A1ZVV3_MICM2|nr:M67 family metallopeptidase [Microscilla marina]EAY25530.1 Mov34/MPN/PAD-1 family [Microscilla marina ATCC 23134]
MKTLNIDQQALKVMQKHAEATYPNECVGFFYGKEDEQTRYIELAVEVPNSKEGDQRRRFEVDPRDYMKAERYALENNTTLLGVYHSHPEHPAIPSEHDLKVAQPFFSYIIISVKGGKSVKTRSWQLDNNQAFAEENILQLQA